MALSATIYKFDIDLSDLDRNLFQHWPLLLALHPSETQQRMVTRLFAFCLNAHEHLAFTKGLSEDSEPDLWQKSYTGEIELWIELGLPDAKRLKKAVSQAQLVKLYIPSSQGSSHWWSIMANECRKYPRLGVYQFDDQAINSFAAQLARTMRLSVLVQDGEVNVSWSNQMLEIPLHTLLEPRA